MMKAKASGFIREEAVPAATSAIGGSSAVPERPASTLGIPSNTTQPIGKVLASS